MDTALRKVTKRGTGLSPQRRDEIHALNETGNFKSMVPKIGYMLGEEKRIRQLYGPKKDLKYQIKLNDVVLDKAEERSKSVEADQSHRGRLMRGSNYAEDPQTIPEHQRTRNEDLFNLKKLN